MCPRRRSTPMSINQLEANLCVQDPNLPIVFSTGRMPRCVGAWRGCKGEMAIYGESPREKKRYGLFFQGCYPPVDEYDEPNWISRHRPLVKDVWNLLHKERTLETYKGGSFRKNPHALLWYSPYGESNEQVVRSISVVPNQRVVLVVEDYPY